MRLPFLPRRIPKAFPSADDKMASLEVEHKKIDVEHKRLDLELKQLRVAAVRRAVTDTEVDTIEALEVATIATHTGNKPMPVIPRRRREEDPMAALGRQFLQDRVKQSPAAELREELEMRRMVRDAADEIDGGDGRRSSSGNGLIDTLTVIADSPLAQAIGAGLGLALQQRVASASPPAPVLVEAAGVVAAPAAAITSIRAVMAIAQLKRKTPDRGAQWILTQADATPALGEVVDQLLACESDEVLPFLDDLLPLIAGDPARSEWLPVLRHLREREEWTLACHAAMCAVVAGQAEAAPESMAAAG